VGGQRSGRLQHPRYSGRQSRGAFAEEIQRQEKRERQLKNAAELRKFKKVLIEQDRDWVLWFMQNFGR